MEKEGKLRVVVVMAGGVKKMVRCAPTRIFTHIYPLGSLKCQGTHHAVSHRLVWKLYGVKRGERGEVRRRAPPLQLADSQSKQGPRGMLAQHLEPCHPHALIVGF